jgi:hypothetical protein
MRIRRVDQPAALRPAREVSGFKTAIYDQVGLGSRDKKEQQKQTAERFRHEPDVNTFWTLFSCRPPSGFIARRVITIE